MRKRIPNTGISRRDLNNLSMQLLRAVAEEAIREGARIVMSTPQSVYVSGGNSTPAMIEAKINEYLYKFRDESKPQQGKSTGILPQIQELENENRSSKVS